MTVAISIALAATSTWAETHCVNPGGTGGCFATVQDAVDAASKNDEIDVAAGSYGAVAVPERGRLRIRGAGAEVTTVLRFAMGESARLTLEDLTVAGSSDSGLRMARSGSLEVYDSVIRDNEGAGITAGEKARVTVLRTTFRDNERDGIKNGKKVRVSDSTFDGNARGVSTPSRLIIENSTLSGNGDGVDVCFRCRVDIFGSTIADNLRGLRIDGFQNRVRIANTLIADNTVDCEQEGGKLISLGHSLIETLGTCLRIGKPELDVVGVDPMLAPLASNGGPTQTHALLAGSPAIDAGDPKPPGKGKKCRPLDQRGNARVGLCDIGAYEAP